LKDFLSALLIIQPTVVQSREKWEFYLDFGSKTNLFFFTTSTKIIFIQNLSTTITKRKVYRPACIENMIDDITEALTVLFFRFTGRTDDIYDGRPPGQSKIYKI
jgi:hypothetical protein